MANSERKRTECAEVAGVVSFEQYDARATGLMSHDPTWTCGMTARVTEMPGPCRLTVGVEEARMILWIMTWAGG